MVHKEGHFSAEGNRIEQNLDGAVEPLKIQLWKKIYIIRERERERREKTKN